MRIDQIKVGDAQMKALVCESMADRKRGLQGILIGPRECMVFPFGTPRAGLHFHMGSVAYPIDIVWTRQGEVMKIVTGSPGDRSSWVGPGDTVYEFLGGFCGAHGIRVGDRLVTEAQATHNLLRTLTEAEEKPAVTLAGLRRTASKKTEAIAVTLASMINRGAANHALVEKARQLFADCTYGDRDRVVRLMYRLVGERSLFLLSAQMQSEAPWSYDKGLAKPHLPPPDDATGQMPADSLGTGTNQPINLEQSFGYDPLLEQSGTGTRPASKTAAGEIHVKDRVKATDDVDGLRKDDKGVVMEIQGDAVKVRFDGEPLPRWIDRSILTVDKAADDVEKEIEEKKKEDGGGGGDAAGGAPAGDEGGGDGGGDGGLADLLSALGGLAEGRDILPACSPSPLWLAPGSLSGGVPSVPKTRQSPGMSRPC